MDEATWLSCTDAQKMLGFLAGRVNDRKLRLFACACGRRLWHFLGDEAIRRAVEVAERFADGQATEYELRKAHDDAMHAAGGGARARVRVAREAAGCAHWDAWVAARSAARYVGNSDRPAHLRDIVGNPFRPQPSVAARWLSWGEGVVPALARAIYDERCFEEMPVLADALEDAGCADADLLNHCRGPDVHARGCWVLDALLANR